MKPQRAVEARDGGLLLHPLRVPDTSARHARRDASPLTRLTGLAVVVGDSGPADEFADAAFDIVGGEANGLEHLIILSDAQPSIGEFDDGEAFPVSPPGADNDPDDSPSLSVHRAAPKIR
jgi:hypothetical protein